ncbi:MAG: SET domain-containing protein-lysine N-methyltransferase [Chlamydiales bacterium]
MQQISHKVLHQDESEIRTYSTEEFERVMQIKFLPNLHFSTEKISKKVKKLCLRAVLREEFERKQKWLGVLFGDDIEKGRELDALIQWIDPQMGYGVFALHDLAPMTYVGEYTGELRKQKWWKDKSNYYCFDYTIGEKTPFVIDAEKQGNLTRFINHSKDPNLEPISVLSGDQVHVILLTKSWIKKGEELTYDYGSNYWKKRSDER